MEVDKVVPLLGLELRPLDDVGLDLLVAGRLITHTEDDLPLLGTMHRIIVVIRLHHIMLMMCIGMRKTVIGNQEIIMIGKEIVLQNVWIGEWTVWQSILGKCGMLEIRGMLFGILGK